MSIPVSCTIFIQPLISSFCLHLHHFNENDQIETEPSLFYTVLPLQCSRKPGLSMSARNGKNPSFPFCVFVLLRFIRFFRTQAPYPLPHYLSHCFHAFFHGFHIERQIHPVLHQSEPVPAVKQPQHMLSQVFIRPQ